MPAKDKYHDVVVRALQKDGWVVAEDPYIIFLDNTRLFIDLAIQKASSDSLLLVEVKTFRNIASVNDPVASYGACSVSCMPMLTSPSQADYVRNESIGTVG